jgi:hypothetical protein
MFGASIIYIFVARVYKEQTHLQSQEVPPDERVTEPVLAAGTPS